MRALKASDPRNMILAAVHDIALRIGRHNSDRLLPGIDHGKSRKTTRNRTESDTAMCQSLVVVPKAHKVDVGFQGNPDMMNVTTRRIHQGTRKVGSGTPATKGARPFTRQMGRVYRDDCGEISDYWRCFDR